MLVSEVLKRTVDFFKTKGIDSARVDTELLLAKALGWNRIDLYTKFEYPMSDDELGKCREFVKRRSQGEPVAYIVGDAGFYKDDFKVGPGVLIPRSDSETMIDELESLRDHQEINSVLSSMDEDQVLQIVDFGCGSGCLGLSALRVLPSAKLLGIDISDRAIEFSQVNAQELGLSERADFMIHSVQDFNLSSIGNERETSIQVILANPPYIEKGDQDLDPMVEMYEPQEALFSEDQGLAHIKSWTQKAIELLGPGGIFLMEIGYTQGDFCTDLLEKSGQFRDVKLVKDLSGHDRVVRAIKS